MFVSVGSKSHESPRMKFLGMEITTRNELGSNQIILATEKEKLILIMDPASKEPPQYIISVFNEKRGQFTVKEYGEITQTKTAKLTF